MKEKLVAASAKVMTQLVMPNDTNPMGNLMGGNLMKWMDIAGAVCSANHCEAQTVTISVDHISFQNPIHLGDVVTIKAKVTRAFNTSVEVYIEVYASDIAGANQRKCNHAYMTFVAIDQESKKPIKIPKVVPLSEAETQRFESASRRRELRMILSGRIEAKDAKEVIEYFGTINGER